MSAAGRVSAGGFREHVGAYRTLTSLEADTRKWLKSILGPEG